MSLLVSFATLLVLALLHGDRPVTVTPGSSPGAGEADTDDVVPAVSRPLTMPTPPPRGWFSGGVSMDEGFAAWRGAPVESLSTWVDDNGTQVPLRVLEPGGSVHGCRCPVDLAVGAIADGESWADAADGAYEERWARRLVAIRTARLGLGPTFIRFAHEMNGNWYPWSVDDGERAAFIDGWKRFRTLQLRVFPEAYLVFAPNRESVDTSIPWTDLFPGADEVDVLGVDYYNQNPFVATAEDFARTAEGTGVGGEPKGIEAHRRFAESVGLPLVVSEWGSNASMGDSPAFITSFRSWIAANAGAGPGKVLYENLFNIDKEERRWALFPATRQPGAAEAYRTSWVRE